MSFFKKLVGRSRSDEKEVAAQVSTGSTGSSLPKDPMSPAMVKPHSHFSPEVTTAAAAPKARAVGASSSLEVPPEMSPEAHDASGLLEDDDDDEFTEPPLRHEPARVTTSFAKDGTNSYARDEDAPHGPQVGYSWAKTNSWISDPGATPGLVDYGAQSAGGKGGAPAVDVITSSFRSDVTDYDSLYTTQQSSYNPAASASGMPPGFAPPGAGQQGMPMPLAGGYPGPCWGWGGFQPMDPAALAGGMSMGFPQGQMSAEEIDAYAEKMMMTARMMQAAAAAQRQQSKAVSSSGAPGVRRHSGSSLVGPAGSMSGSGAATGSTATGATPRSTVDCVVEESQRTTVMLRNIPNDYSRDMLLALLDEEGFRGSYDFVYLPQDFKRRAGLGYAFINIINHNEAVRFMSHFSGFNNWKFSSQKVCEAAWGAPLQGLEQHIYRYKNSPLMHPDVPDEFKPVLFHEGIRISFPEPTKRIRPPRMKLGAVGGSAGGLGLEAALEGDEMM